MPNDTQICIPIYNYIALSPKEKIKILCIGLSVQSVISCFFNALVIYAIIKTKQHQENKSIVLILLASVADICIAVVGNSFFMVAITIGKRIACQTMYIIHAIITSNLYGSSYMVCFISMDRFLRIYFLQRYSEVFTNTRFKISIAIVMAIVIFQSALNGVGPTIFGFEVGGKLSIPLNVIIVSSTLILHFVSIYKLRKQDIQTIGNRGLTKMASIYLTIFLLCYIPIFIYAVVLRNFFRGVDPVDLGMVTYAAYYIRTLSGLVNAIAFLVKNRKAKELLRNIFRKFCSNGRRIRPLEQQQTTNRDTGTGKVPKADSNH